MSIEIDISFIHQQSWRERVQAWFNHASRQSQLGIILGLIPSIVVWRLWRPHCIARMKGKAENLRDVMWSSIKYWVRVLTGNVNKVSKLSACDMQVLARLEVPIVELRCKQLQVVRWSMPSPGQFKLNLDGRSLGNSGPGGAGWCAS